MLTIRDHQIHALGPQVRAAFRERLTGFVCDTLPERTAGLSAAELEARVGAAELEAEALGLRRQRAIARFVALRLWLTAEPAALDELRAQLTSGRGDPESLLRRWLEEAMPARPEAMTPAAAEQPR